MDFAKLENNIIDMVKEEQLKLGYRRETIRLYYPAESLRRLLGEGAGAQPGKDSSGQSGAQPDMGSSGQSGAQPDAEASGLAGVLRDFCREASGRLGPVEVFPAGQGRYCIVIPPEGAAYVHEHTDSSEFLSEFIHVIAGHGSMEEVFEVFRRHSAHVHIEQASHGEFDYLAYFADGMPDAYRYCLTDEDGHIIYHRYTEADYLDFAFGS